jgi:hypothetical protein
MKDDTFRKILALLRRLDEAKIFFTLHRFRDDAIMVFIHVPGERWEVEFVDYDDQVHVEIERFKSDGEIYDESVLDELFAQYSA